MNIAINILIMVSRLVMAAYVGWSIAKITNDYGMTRRKSFLCFVAAMTALLLAEQPFRL